MGYLKNIWNTVKNSKKKVRPDGTFNNDSSSETDIECSSTDIQIPGSNALKLSRTTSSESEFSSDGYRISLFSDLSLRKDKDMEKYNKNGISPLELDQSLKMRAYRMSIYMM